ncbi:MAG: hypothetical protein KF861_03970 [Planctomycetaceae bacterium]|nr:hypothetical protein [Planctomycetaceae bacterium]
MLVSVALVLLMMTIFASAFQIATGNLLKQRGAAENNQRVRAAFAAIEGDLGKRTFRQREDALTQTIYLNGGRDELSHRANQLARGIVPLHPDYYLPGLGGKGRSVDAARERGYFYISENDPFNDGDDVLQFTVDASIIDLGNADTTPYTGRARALGPTWDTAGAGSPVNVDQPIWDDGVGYKINPTTRNPESYVAADNGTSKSRYAEVSYFLRNGNLMRRVMLIRDPAQPNPPGPVGEEGQPTADNGTEFIQGNFTSPDFWNRFDFSATRLDPESFPPTDVVNAEPIRMRFNTATDLDNSKVSPPRSYSAAVGPRAVGVRPIALGNPQFRFGHDPSPRHAPPPAGVLPPGTERVARLQGRPREHRNSSDPATFIGRYTQEETSHSTFGFPALESGPGGAGAGTFRGTPMTTSDVPLVSFVLNDSNENSRVDQYENGPRKGEDILMPNVHAFDIKVWDAALGQWMDLGHENAIGDWHRGQVYNAAVPNGTFDLYYPTGQPRENASALRAMYRYGSLSQSVAPGAINRTFDTWHPQFNFDTFNDRLGTPPANFHLAREDALDDPPPFRPLWTDRANFTDFTQSDGPRPTVWLPDNNYSAPARVFPFPRARNAATNEYYPGHQSLFYQLVGGQDLDGSGTLTSGPTEPAWPVVAGEEVQDGEIRWRAFNNTIGLQAIQITIRFLDPSSKQMRQVTLVHSFVEL